MRPSALEVVPSQPSLSFPPRYHPIEAAHLVQSRLDLSRQSLVVLHSGGSFGLQHDVRAGQLPRVLVRHADDRRIRHVGIAQEVSLELGRRDLHAFHFDEFLCYTTQVGSNVSGPRHVNGSDKRHRAGRGGRLHTLIRSTTNMLPSASNTTSSPVRSHLSFRSASLSGEGAAINAYPSSNASSVLHILSVSL